MTAIETTKEKWCEAEVHRIAGEIALKPRKSGATQAEAYFERALQSPANNKQNPGAISSRRSTAGSPRASTRSI
jgi:hypothetical protein